MLYRIMVLALLLGLSFPGLARDKKKKSPLNGDWRLQAMIVNNEPVWLKGDTSSLMLFAARQIGKPELASEDSLVLLEKIRTLMPRFDSVCLQLSEQGTYRFTRLNSSDPLKAPVTETGSYMLLPTEKTIVLKAAEGLEETLEYEQTDANQLRLLSRSTEFSGEFRFVRASH